MAGREIPSENGELVPLVGGGQWRPSGDLTLRARLTPVYQAIGSEKHRGRRPARAGAGAHPRGERLGAADSDADAGDEG